MQKRSDCVRTHYLTSHCNNISIFLLPVVVSHCTANSDYNFTSVILTFQSGLQGSDTQCTNLSIIDNNVLEDSEDFFVTLDSSDSDVRIDPDLDQASVVIIDNDGQL